MSLLRNRGHAALMPKTSSWLENRHNIIICSLQALNWQEKKKKKFDIKLQINHARLLYQRHSAEASGIIDKDFNWMPVFVPWKKKHELVSIEKFLRKRHNSAILNYDHTSYFGFGSTGGNLGDVRRTFSLQKCWRQMQISYKIYRHRPAIFSIFGRFL